MKDQGFGQLWVIASGLIVVFILATVVLPGLGGQGRTDGSSDTVDGVSERELRFNAPTTTLSSDPKPLGQSLELTATAAPASVTTGKGGEYTWVVAMDGPEVNNGSVVLTYAKQQVDWSPGKGTSAIGLGARFSQGAGAASMSVSTSMVLTLHAYGNYTLRLWLADASGLLTDEPLNMTAVSPVREVTFLVDPAANPLIELTQTFSVPPSAVGRGAWTTLSVSDSASVDGWTGTVVDHLAISKEGIGGMDVQVKMDTSTGYYFLSWKDTGDRLEGELGRTHISEADSMGPPRAWNLTFELSFATAGSYIVEVWSTQLSTGSALVQTSTAHVDVA